MIFLQINNQENHTYMPPSVYIFLLHFLHFILSIFYFFIIFFQWMFMGVRVFAIVWEIVNVIREGITTVKVFINILLLLLLLLLRLLSFVVQWLKNIKGKKVLFASFEKIKEDGWVFQYAKHKIIGFLFWLPLLFKMSATAFIF